MSKAKATGQTKNEVEEFDITFICTYTVYSIIWGKDIGVALKCI